MKRTRLYFISIVILSMLFISCADKEAKPDKELLGKWEYLKIETDIVTSDSAFSSLMKAKFKAGPPELPGEDENVALFNFREKGILENKGNPGTYSVSGDQMRMRIEGRTDLFNFEIREDTLILKVDFLSDNIKEENVLNAPDSVKVEKFLFTLYLLKIK